MCCKVSNKFISQILMAIVVAVFCFSYRTIRAAEYGYHPSNTLFLGAGLDAADPTSARPSCISFKVAPVSGGVDGVRFEAKLVKSRRELYRTLGISTSM